MDEYFPLCWKWQALQRITFINFVAISVTEAPPPPKKKEIKIICHIARTHQDFEHLNNNKEMPSAVCI